RVRRRRAARRHRRARPETRTSQLPARLRLRRGYGRAQLRTSNRRTATGDARLTRVAARACRALTVRTEVEGDPAPPGRARVDRAGRIRALRVPAGDRPR